MASHIWSLLFPPSILRTLQKLQSQDASQNAPSMSLAHLPNVSYKELQRWLIKLIQKRNKALQFIEDKHGDDSILTKICHLEFVAYEQKRNN